MLSITGGVAAALAAARAGQRTSPREASTVSDAAFGSLPRKGRMRSRDILELASAPPRYRRGESALTQPIHRPYHLQAAAYNPLDTARTAVAEALHRERPADTAARGDAIAQQLMAQGGLVAGLVAGKCVRAAIATTNAQIIVKVAGRTNDDGLTPPMRHHPNLVGPRDTQLAVAQATELREAGAAGEQALASAEGSAAAVSIVADAMHVANESHSAAIARIATNVAIETSQKHQQLRSAAEEVAREREGQLATLRARFAELKREAGDFHAQAITALVDLAAKANDEKATVS